MICRDAYDIIVQQPEMDGGDSAFTTGIMAFSGSTRDMLLMHNFVTESYELMRHPYQTTNTGDAPHSDPKSISRDQVVAFYGGLYGQTDPEFYTGMSCLQYADQWFVNRDLLLPVNRVYLYKLSKARAPLYLYPLAYLNLILHLIWTVFIPKDKELNQTALTCAVYGKFWLKALLFVRPDLYQNITDYFSGWRDKAEIGQVFITKLKRMANV